LTVEDPAIPDAGTYFAVEGTSASGANKGYPIKLGWYGRVCGVMNWHGAKRGYVVRQPVGKGLGALVRLRLVKSGPTLRLEVDGKLLGEWTDPDPLTQLKSVVLAAYSCKGWADDLVVEAADGKAALRETFDVPAVVHARFPGAFPLKDPPRSSFFSADMPVYITWEWGPEMHSLWKEDGRFDWWEVDQYLRKIAAFDPDGRLHVRFNFRRAPKWWRSRNADQMVHVRRGSGQPTATDVVSFASKPYWDAAERAARDLGRFAREHPEGWRLIAVTYSGGVCEFFPHWGEGRYSDYSPAFLAGFRAWLKACYGTDQGLRAAWQRETITLDTAELPSPAERLKGDWHDFYDPAKGRQRIDFCTYYAEVTTSLITRLARAFKEGSDGRLYTRPMAGYQPGHAGFRFHSGPHADFATVLDCPWIDGFFMPHDYRGRGYGGYTAFEIPVASVLLHGKTYITEIDDRTHLMRGRGQSRTETPWQTAQSIKRNVATALCHASGAEFKDWGKGWFEDRATMDVIRRMNRLAQESLRHDRSPTAQIAVVINPRSTKYLRDESPIYRTLNHQQMHLCYPRIGAPHDRVMIDDLTKARGYDLYIIQDCLHLTDTERQVIRNTACRGGKTVLWLYAPGIVGDDGIDVGRTGELAGMTIRCHSAKARFHLKLSNGTHPYTQGVADREYPTYESLSPFFYVDDPDATILGLGWYQFGITKPAFAVKRMERWTSVYSSLPVLPPAVIRNIAREAGVHIYCDSNDFVAANNWLLCVCAASSGTRTIRLPRQASVTDAMTGEETARNASAFEVEMKYGETRVWTLQQ